VTGAELLRARPDLAPEIMAAFGQVIGRLGDPGESHSDAHLATDAHRLAGTDLGPLTDRAIPNPTTALSSASSAVTLDDLRFEDEQLVGITRNGLRGAIASLWQIRDGALRGIAVEASGLEIDAEALTRAAVLATLQHGSTPTDLERARRDLTELLEYGARARLKGFEPLEPRPTHLLIRQGLQTDNVAAIAAGLVSERLPANIAPRILGLGRRVTRPDFCVPWMTQMGIHALCGAVSRGISRRRDEVPSGHPLIDRLLAEAATATPAGRAQGLSAAAVHVADLPDDPRLPPLLLALQILDAAGRLDAPPEAVLTQVVASL